MTKQDEFEIRQSITEYESSLIPQVLAAYSGIGPQIVISDRLYEQAIEEDQDEVIKLRYEQFTELLGMILDLNEFFLVACSYMKELSKLVDNSDTEALCDMYEGKFSMHRELLEEKNLWMDEFD